ncbi:hypothetical protein LCGC14_1078440 [marine sediment metagenome]|uniref:Uncharacterized protein n=1 Tax=marine sediment metagenome TaxID=412755 RepID=A0A0F9N3M1_9ZZZZ
MPGYRLTSGERMATYLSENLNESEEVSGPTRLTGYTLTNTGTMDRYVTLKGGTKKIVVVVPPGETKSISGMSEAFPEGLAVESLKGRGITSTASDS